MKLLFVLLALVPMVYCGHLTEEDQMMIQEMSAEQLELSLSWRPLIRAICKIINTAGGPACDIACPMAAQSLGFPEVICSVVCRMIKCPPMTEINTCA